ncbi:Hpt domain-containing protein [Roseibium hamelinense]|uniref:Hpt domain-containing protein n=1 Tax=Roseibium hamelinense TaxID=150831 RepID=A0A562T9T6_9HYPH|nr:Hpt domain-containing protein [Roseibium hamelinense]MTI45282.1 Hpt domain-containing protein [Roseibium hamelinense]TWI90355.1 Hpt domain-containing protein [Roseibium hamelinense]
MAQTSSAVFTRSAGYDAPIDLVRLAANTMGNRDLEVQVLRLFATQSHSALEQLDACDDLQSAKVIVHTLKGSARAVGADKIAAVCEALEKELETGNPKRVQQLARSVGEANSYIDDLLSPAS